MSKKRVGFPSEERDDEPESSASETSSSRPLLGVEAVVAVRDGKVWSQLIEMLISLVLLFLLYQYVLLCLFQKKQDNIKRGRQNAELLHIVSQTANMSSSRSSDDSESMKEEIKRLRQALAEKEAALQSKAEEVNAASIVDQIKAEMAANFKDLERRLVQIVDDKMNDVLRKSNHTSLQLVEEWLKNSPL